MTEHKVPIRPHRPCRKPGCNEITQNANGFCNAHQYAYEEMIERAKKRRSENRDNSSKRGYGSYWRCVRNIKLSNDPFCEECGQPAIVVHHINHNQFDNREENLKSLCWSCHEKEHGRKKRLLDIEVG